MIKKQCYCPRLFPGYHIYAHFHDKEVGDVYMLDAKTQDNKTFQIFIMKDPYYVMKIMASWKKFDEL